MSRPVEKERGGGPNRQMLRRTLALMALCGIAAFLVLLIRLYKLQIIDHAYYEELAIQQQLREAATSGLLLVTGGPGTGKTTVIREIIFQELKFSSAAHILVVSQSNVAVDNVLRGFVGNEMFFCI